MRYTPRQYAKALHAALIKKTPDERKQILQGFVNSLLKRKSQSRLGLIVKAYEKEYLTFSGMRKVEVESVSGLSKSIRQEIEAILGKKTFFIDKTTPALLAGIRLLVDNELLVDASAKSALDKLF